MKSIVNGVETDEEVPGPNPGMLAAVQDGVTEADEDPEAAKALETEKNAVKALWKEYDQARKFDQDARAQYAIDRRYAAGTANLNWAVRANLTGAFIDILVSFLYARNPDVSVSKAPKIDTTGTSQEDDFAKTMELVVSSLWKAPTARLKTQCRAQVRSCLSVGIGWLKVILVSKGDNIPEMRQQLNDTRDNIKRIESFRAAYVVDPATGEVTPPEGCDDSQETLDAKLVEYNETLASQQKKYEVAIRKALAIDYVRAEDMQCSLDVSEVTDHVNAGWNANAIYRPISELKAMFPILSEPDVKGATQYFRRGQKDLQAVSDQVAITGLASSGSNSEIDAQKADQYVTGESSTGVSAADQQMPFGKIVELWNRKTGHVHTMIDGVDRWVKQPYVPDYPSTRFYPYFAIAFYPVDGSRHPQSLTWRLLKLEEEYASMRSSQRLTRQRAAPGTLFDSSGVEPDDIAKIERSTQQEYIGIKPMNSTKSIRDLFVEKPVAVGDVRLYDASPILRDMEKIAGVQEALQSSASPEKTATQSEIEQSGFASRTTADRDVLETMLTEMAHYTGELALSGLDDKDAQRIAGARAFWPVGMDIDDLLTMVEIQIEAGTTGKPKTSGDKEAWGVVLPLIKETIMQVQEARMGGNEPLAQALIALLRETMGRMGIETDISKFIPAMPAPAPVMPGVTPPMPGTPGMPGDPSAMPPGADPTAPPMPGQDPGLGEMVAPQLDAPQLSNPELAPPMV